MKQLLFSLIFLNQIILSTHSPCTIEPLAGKLPDKACMLQDFIKAFKKNGTHELHGKIILFHGKMGIGKTTAIRAIAKNSGAILKEFEFSECLHEKSYEGTKKLFEEVEQLSKRSNQPIIILLENIDMADDDDEFNFYEAKTFAKIVESILLNLKNPAITTIITYNTRTVDIPDHMSRFFSKVHWQKPNLENRKALIPFFFKTFPSQLNEKEINDIATKTHGYTARKIEKLFKQAFAIGQKENTSTITYEHTKQALEEEV